MKRSTDGQLAEIGINDLVLFLMRSWKLALLFVTIVTVITIFQFKKNPSFTAFGIILVEGEKSDPTQAIVERVAGTENYFNEDPETRLDKFIMLYSSREFAMELAKHLVSSGADKNFLPLFFPNNKTDKYNIEDIADLLQSSVGYDKFINQTIKISLSHSDPKAAVQAMNIFLDVLVATIVERDSRNNSQAKEFLNVQLKKLEQRFSEIDENIDLQIIKDLKSTKKMRIGGGTGAGTRSLDDIDKKIFDLKIDLKEVESILKISEGSSKDILPTSAIDKYSLSSTTESQKRRAELLKIRIASLENAQAEALLREENNPSKEKVIADLIRKKEMEYQLYGEMRKGVLSLDLQKISTLNRTKILEKARPGSARASNSFFIAMVKRAVFAAVAACVLLLLFEVMNPVIRSRKDLDGLKIHFLGSLPDLDFRVRRNRFLTMFQPFSWKRKNKNFMHILDLVPDSYHDLVFKNVKSRIVNFRMSGANTGPKVISVMSGSPGEGKTSVSSNLAKSLAAGGKRVLLIDADLRMRALSESLGYGKNMGVSDYLINPRGDFAKPLVQKISPELDLLPTGKYWPQATELVSGKDFTEMVIAMRNFYDYVVLDTPPAIPYSEVVPIAKCSDLVVLVISAGATKISSFDRVLDKLQYNMDVPIGCVLNMHEDEQMAAYYPAYNYKNHHAA